MTKGLNVLSLFDGISCGRVALERASLPVNHYFASEIDENATKISSHNYPDIIRLGDINGLTEGRLKELPRIDVILSGSPCQGFSRSGKGLNFEDSRSRLFFNFVDILNWIRENNNPNVKFLLENVKMKNEWRDVISEYVGVPHIEINSRLLSAQNRPRLYWTDIEGAGIPEDAGVVLKDILDPNEMVLYGHRVGSLTVCNSFSEASRGLVNVVDGEIRISQTVKKGYIVAEDGDGVNLSFPTSKSRRGRVIKQKSSTLDCACNIGVLSNNEVRRLTLTELERLQTLPDGYTDVPGVGEGARKKALGNGWTVDVIAHILRNLKTNKDEA